MKKIFNKIFFMSFSAIFAFILISCDKTRALEEDNKEQIEHIHSFSEEYLYNEISHWKECACGIKSEEIIHSFDSENVLQGTSVENVSKVKRICSVCQYEVTLHTPQQNHQHTYSNVWSYDENNHFHQATCEHEEEKKDIGAHTYGAWIIVTEAQENMPGLKKRECSVCKHEITKEIPSKVHQHTYSNAWSYDANNHFYQATCEHEGEKKDIGVHTYGAWIIVIEAQEDVSGLKKRKCSVCKYEQTQIIEMEDHQHSFSEIWSIDKEPTCDSMGSKSHHCLTCDEKKDITEIPALGHSYNLWNLEISPTKESTGLLSRLCQKDSSHREEYVLPVLNPIDYRYQITISPTCEENGLEEYRFQKDGQEISITNEITFTGHQAASNWFSDNSYHWLACETCKNMMSKTEHSYDDNYNCVICGYIHNLGTPGLYYILTGDGSSYSVSNYFGMDTIIEIPEKHNNLPVTRLGENLFSNQDIVEVTLPSSIKKIGESAFDHCYKLSKINLPDGLLEIGASAFDSCFNLNEITIPNSVLSIGDSAFASCYKINKIMIPDSVLSIGAKAFAYCQSVTELYISKNVTTIGEMAFQACFDLLRIEIPKTVQVIQNSTFAHCNKLESVLIAEGVEIISNNAFGECSNLRELVLPKTLTQIKNGAFYLCEKLNDIYFNGTLQEWSNLTKDGFENYNCSPTIYTYSSTRPTNIGNYWYYNKENIITKW